MRKRSLEQTDDTIVYRNPDRSAVADGAGPEYLAQTRATAAVASAHKRRQQAAEEAASAAVDAVSAGVVNANRNLLDAQQQFVGAGGVHPNSRLRPRKYSVKLARCGENRTCVQAAREHGVVAPAQAAATRARAGTGLGSARRLGSGSGEPVSTEGASEKVAAADQARGPGAVLSGVRRALTKVRRSVER